MTLKAKELGFKEVTRLIFKDLFANRSVFEWCYLIILSSIPIILELTLDAKQHDWLGLVASWTGIVCVIFVNEGRVSNYFFGLTNSLIYLYLALGSGFYGEVFTTLYFTVMQPIGLFLWLNASRFKKEEQSFVVRSLSFTGWIKNILLTLFTWLFMGFAYQSIGSNRPFRDSITDGTNVTGQLLMTGYYWEQWLFWIATNLFSIYLWWGTSIHMQGMYWVYLINSCYGWYTWSKEAKKAAL
nr:nicotinamide riboside transporter PnuC [Streptococcus loxodontisalivarius]